MVVFRYARHHSSVIINKWKPLEQPEGKQNDRHRAKNDSNKSNYIIKIDYNVEMYLTIFNENDLNYMRYGAFYLESTDI